MTEFGRWSVCDIHLLCELFFISFYLCDSLYGLFALSVRRHTDFYQLLRRLTITDTLSFIPSFSFLQNFYFFLFFHSIFFSTFCPRSHFVSHFLFVSLWFLLPITAFHQLPLFKFFLCLFLSFFIPLSLYSFPLLRHVRNIFRFSLFAIFILLLCIHSLILHNLTTLWQHISMA